MHDLSLPHVSMQCMQSAILFYQFRPSVRPSLRLFVCPKPVLCLNEWTYRHTFFDLLTAASLYFLQGWRPRGICLGSRRPRGSFLTGSASPRPHTVLPWSCLGLDLTASALPRSFCLGLGSVWYLIYLFYETSL